VPSEERKKTMNADFKTFVDAQNWNTMTRSVGNYLPSNGLQLSEQVALSTIAAEARNRPILDLGVGTGRTVRALMDISENYVGVDYVPKMVATCRQRFPGVHFVHGDARKLSQFEDNSFFLIVFSQNGICMADHAGRMAILKEAFRLLEPGGVFLFSTYNLNGSRYKAPFRFPSFRLTNDPFKLVVRGFRFASHTVVRIVNRLRFARLEQRCSEYSIINDGCHDYSMLLYYASLENHFRQLNSTGFGEVLAFDAQGQRITSSSSENSIRLLARKPRRGSRDDLPFSLHSAPNSR
jgi:ubiquinone/menaquinone biosynthesis C-methylase UbiE